jgi:hypothetical protein
MIKMIDFLVRQILAAPEDIQEQVVELVCPSRSRKRVLESIKNGHSDLIRATLERKTPEDHQEVLNLVMDSPGPAA